MPGRRFPEYLAVMCGLIRRYGNHEPTVADALLRLLRTCADVAGARPEMCTAIAEQARIIIADACPRRGGRYARRAPLLHGQTSSRCVPVTRRPART